jgi:DNA-binding response OmpR family regulator
VVPTVSDIIGCASIARPPSNPITKPAPAAARAAPMGWRRAGACSDSQRPGWASARSSGAVSVGLNGSVGEAVSSESRCGRSALVMIQLLVVRLRYEADVGTDCEANLKTHTVDVIFRFASDNAGQNGGVASNKDVYRDAPRVLVVEDSDGIREMVVEALNGAGYAATGRPDGRDLESALDGNRPDAVVLDVMVPGRDGFALIDVVRAWGDVGVLMLTARDALSDRVRGLDGGADDYVVKPFEMAELISRVGAVLRRRGHIADTVEIGDLLLDRGAGVATRAGQPLALTATELKLLDFLVDQRGRIVSATQILTAVWGYTAYDDNLVHVHISSLRRKLEAHGPRMVHTVRGIGYRLQTPGR